MGQKPTTDKSDVDVVAAAERVPVAGDMAAAASASVTIHDIARMAGVSIGTVDRVLHNRGKVAADKLEKIQAIVQQSGYRPNVFASHLSGGATRSIGVLIPQSHSDHGYWGLVRTGMEQAAAELVPLHVSVAFETFDRFSPGSGPAAFSRLRAQTPGTAALAIAPTPSDVFRPLAHEVPLSQNLLFFDTDLDGVRPHSFIGQDPQQGGYLSARLLCLLAPAPQVLAAVRFRNGDEHLEKRLEGFRRYCREQERVVRVIELDPSAAPAARRDILTEALGSITNIWGLFVPNASASECVGLKDGLRIVGYDLVPANVAALKAGGIAVLVSQRPRIMGYETIMRLGRNLVFGETLAARISLPIDIVMRENLEQHE